jgi:hypothetical protein
MGSMGVLPPQIQALLQMAQGNSTQATGSAPPPDQMPQMPGQPPPQPQQGALPPTGPFDSNVQGVTAVDRALAAQPNIANPNAALDTRNQDYAALQQKLSDMQAPQIAPHNRFLRFLTATAPGAAISNAMYGPEVRQYNVQRQNIADQMEAIKARTGISEQQLDSGTKLAGTAGNVVHQGQEFQLGNTRNDIAKSRSDNQAANIARQSSNDLVRQSQGWARLSEQAQQEKAREWFNQAIINVSGQRIAAGMDENSARIQAQQDVRAEMAQNQYLTKNPLLSKIMSGLGLAPDLTSTPAAQSPKVMGTPTPAGAPKKPAAGGKVGTYDPKTKQVVWH